MGAWFPSVYGWGGGGEAGNMTCQHSLLMPTGFVRLTKRDLQALEGEGETYKIYTVLSN